MITKGMNENTKLLLGLRKDRKQESGAIMLEVIAVLSLMALMGTMLFRQIYLRNQELSNIQMASEIRVIKEAFGAWIQANTVETNSCPTDGTEMCGVLSMNDLRTAVEDYLPLAYRSKGVIDDYNLYLRCELVGQTATHVGYRRCYGIVIPTLDSLPDDWDFKRAARVATLIGIDGGVYGSNLTTAASCGGALVGFVGSMGSWEMCVAPGILPDRDGDTYMAMTAIDVFQPEIESQTVAVNLDPDLDFALRHTQVYGRFLAGLNGCYTTNHQAANLVAGETVARDVVWDPASQSTVCQPAFYVEPSDGNTATGNVRVLNDLSVGYDYINQNAAMRFDKDGMIVFEKATVPDPQNSDQDINYVLDPKYTSVLNDVKIMSRGGARLSEILPNYILKTQEERNCELVMNTDTVHTCTYGEVTMPQCPEGYKKAIAVIPNRFGYGLTVLGSGYAVSSRRTFQIVVKVNGTDSATDTTKVNEIFQGRDDVTTLEVMAKYSGAGKISDDHTERSRSIIQTYCVFDAAKFALPQNKRGAEDDDAVSMAKTAEECLTYGGVWSAANSTCTHNPTPADIP